MRLFEKFFRSQATSVGKENPEIRPDVLPDLQEIPLPEVDRRKYNPEIGQRIIDDIQREEDEEGERERDIEKIKRKPTIQ